MLRSRPVVLLASTALLAAGLAFSAAAADNALLVPPRPRAPLLAGPDLEESSSRDVPTLRRAILAENELAAAESFLRDVAAQEAVKAEDHSAYFQVFARATELVDLKGVIDEMSSVHSIRQSLSRRTGCAFCLDGAAFPAWARRNIPGIGDAKLSSLGKVLWNWDQLTHAQKAWVEAQKKKAAWPKLDFSARHAVLRAWALAERDAMMKLSPADAEAGEAYASRAYEASQVLGSHEMSDLWKRVGIVEQAFQSLAEARARVAMGSDPRQKELLAQALAASTPEARLSALARIFENYGERPAALLTAAPPRADQKFDADSRKLVGAMLKTAMLKETEGTFAGADLKEFYARVPLDVVFSTTSMSAYGWYEHGGDALYFNERYIEDYLKTRGASVESLKRDPAMLQHLARVFAPTFVHEVQHHRQDVWARENKIPRLYHQGDEVEAFQIGALFMMQKLGADKKFEAWAEKEAAVSSFVGAKLAQARRMEEEGPEYFERIIPNTHYPEILSNEATAWCHILWHNSVSGSIETELSRRGRLSAAARKKLERSAPALKKSYPTAEAFRADLMRSSTETLDSYLQGAKAAAANSAKHYNQLRARQEAVAATTRERYNALMPREGMRTETGIDAPLSPLGPDQEDR